MQLTDLGLDPLRSRFPVDRLYAFAGRGSVQALPGTVLGIGGFFAPPLSGRDFALRYALHLPDHDTTIGDSPRRAHDGPPQMMLQQTSWLPWAISRQATFHRQLKDELVSLDIQSELTSPADADGIVLKVKLTLRSPDRLALQIKPVMERVQGAVGTCPPAAWNYQPPAADHQIWAQGPGTWRVDDYRLHLLADGPGAEPDGSMHLTLTQGRPRTLYLGVSLQGPGMMPMIGQLKDHAATAHVWWEDRYATLNKKLGPSLQAMDTPRRKLFLRGWLTAMSCRWDRENFIARPYYATGGLDGGSLCCYLWDLAFASGLIARLEGRKLRRLIEQLVDVESIFEGYALSPLAPQWLGVFYAFSPFALTKIIADYVAATGDHAFLRKKIGGRMVIDTLTQIVDQLDERFATRAGVLDMGHNRHLIELMTAGYEGVIPNPNFEQVWCYRTLDGLRQSAKVPRRPGDLRRAEKLLQACNRLFWNEREGWLFPADQREQAGIWSIQPLSALRLGVYDPQQAQRMAAHLRDGRFLGPAGIYSIARDDQAHFTLSDVDWGGGGCYCGHVGIVLEGLAHYGLHATAERVLERIAWWADDLPYLPQQTRADAAEGDGRPNTIAGAAICQALLALQEHAPGTP